MYALKASVFLTVILHTTEEFEPFGEVFIDSPNPASVSSLSIEADWTIVGCDATSDQPQAVRLYP